MATVSRAPSIASQNPPLPHVSALIQSAENRGTTFDARKTLSSQRPTKPRSTPSSPQNQFQDLRSTPNIHLLASLPDFYPPEFTPSASHRRCKSSGVHSPSSGAASIAGDSIFELPTPIPIESPSSSVALSFVAELEDTSGHNYEAVPPLPIKTQLVPLTDTSMLFRTNKLTSQAILKVVDDTIASIEAANQELLVRAEAAEASAYRLHVSNTELRSRIEELSLSYRPKPPSKSMGTQTNPRTSPRHSPQNSMERNRNQIPLAKSASAGPLRSAVPSIHLPHKVSSASITSSGPQTAQLVKIVQLKPDPLHSHTAYSPLTDPLDQPDTIPQPKSRRSIRSLKFLQRHHAENLAQPLTPSTNKASRQSSDRPRTADATSPPAFTSRFSTLGQGTPPLPELPIFLSLSTGNHNMSLTPNSIGDPKESAKRTRRHTRTVSFEEAKRIAAQTNGIPKLAVPKYPLGEMSPSPIEGVVEIGLGIQEAEREGEEVKPLRSQRSRVRFLLGEGGIKDMLEERRKDKDKEKKKIGGFFKWGKKGEEVVAS